MQIDALTTPAIQSKIAALDDLIAHMDRVGYGHLGTTIRADLYLLKKELKKRIGNQQLNQ